MNKDIVDIILITFNAGILGYLLYNCIDIYQKKKRDKVINECKELVASMKEDINEMLEICEDMMNRISDNDKQGEE